MADTGSRLKSHEDSTGAKQKRCNGGSAPAARPSSSGHLIEKDGYLYKWNQNSKFVLVELVFSKYLVNYVNIGDKSIHLVFKGEQPDMKLELSNVVDISSSAVTTQETRVFCKLAKHIVNRLWQTLEKPVPVTPNGCVPEVAKTSTPDVSSDVQELAHIKHDWFEKGDLIYIHVYVRSVVEEQLSATFGEDFLVFEFSTRHEEFLKVYPTSSARTVFRWQISLKKKIDVENSSFDVKTAYVNIQLKKQDSLRWGSLEAPSFPARATLAQYGAAAGATTKPCKIQKGPLRSDPAKMQQKKPANGIKTSVNGKDQKPKDSLEGACKTSAKEVSESNGTVKVKVHAQPSNGTSQSRTDKTQDGDISCEKNGGHNGMDYEQASKTTATASVNGQNGTTEAAVHGQNGAKDASVCGQNGTQTESNGVCGRTNGVAQTDNKIPHSAKTQDYENEHKTQVSAGIFHHKHTQAALDKEGTSEEKRTTESAVNGEKVVGNACEMPQTSAHENVQSKPECNIATKEQGINTESQDHDRSRTNGTQNIAQEQSYPGEHGVTVKVSNTVNKQEISGSVNEEEKARIEDFSVDEERNDIAQRKLSLTHENQEEVTLYSSTTNTTEEEGQFSARQVHQGPHAPTENEDKVQPHPRVPSENEGDVEEGMDEEDAGDVAAASQKDAQIVRTHLGMTGLENIGNTCFLNATLQCLINVPKLKDYFEGDYFKDEVNRNNALGFNGKLAVSFATLLKKMWMGTDSYLAPSKLRSVFAEKYTQFKNFLQHDSQEFLAFLLDGLHEDLNRIAKKPYIEHEEKPGCPDEELAKEAWRLHKARNDSVIVDQFQGQLKSKLTCPECGKVSITFDPFMFLSVPLPKQQILLQLFVFFKDPHQKPLKMTVRVSKDPTVSQVLECVAKKLNLCAEDLRMFETYKCKIHKGFKTTDVLSTVSSSDVFIVNEVWSEEDLDEDSDEEVLEVAFIQRLLYPLTVRQCSNCRQSSNGGELKRCTRCLCVGYCSHACQKNHWPTHKSTCRPSPQPIGLPFIVSLPASQATYSRLCELVEVYASYSVQATQMITSPSEDCEQNASSPSDASAPLQGDLSTSNSSLSGSLDSLGSNSSSPAPKYYFKPVNVYGQSIMGAAGERLKDLGEESLSDLLAGKLFSIDWRNNPQMKDYVAVEKKALECDEHESCQGESLPNYDHCTLSDCIELFTEPETLAPQEAWYCPQCKEHREATKQMSLWMLPPVLIVHLKRFSFRNVLYRDKLNKFVDFPLRHLDMSPFVTGNGESQHCEYDLFGVVNHTGSVHFGHYTAYARFPGQIPHANGLATDQIGWRLFDDRVVSRASETSVKTKNAYVLFYRRRDTAASDVTNDITTKNC